MSSDIIYLPDSKTKGPMKKLKNSHRVTILSYHSSCKNICCSTTGRSTFKLTTLNFNFFGFNAVGGRPRLFTTLNNNYRIRSNESILLITKRKKVIHIIFYIILRSLKSHKTLFQNFVLVLLY